MRIGVACVMQESNSFARDCAPFENFTIASGDQVLEISRGTNTEIGGAVEELEGLGHKAVPLVYAYDTASGPIADSAFEALSALLLDVVRREHCDALLIALHGAWLSPSFGSCDAELMRRVRAEVGPKVPIVITLDYHANVRPLLLESVDALVGYRTYPHIDMGDTGRKAARVLHRITSERLSAVSYWLPIPLLAAPQGSTTEQSPVNELLAEMDECFASPDILSSSFFCVQPWLDVPEVSSSLVVVAKEPSADITKRLKKLAQSLWNRRGELDVNWVAPENLGAVVEREPRRPVIVSEAFDATSGGSIGDHPGLLRLLLSHKEKFSSVLFLVDAEVAELAWIAGRGKTISAKLAGKSDDRFGAPVEISATVESLSDGAWTLKGPVATGRVTQMGKTAVLRADRLRIVVASKSAVTFDPELYRSVGIVLEQEDIIAVKSPAMYRAAYRELSGATVDLDMPGVCRGNLRLCPFHKIGRPIYPLDDFEWQPAIEDIAVYSQGRDRNK